MNFSIGIHELFTSNCENKERKSVTSLKKIPVQAKKDNVWNSDFTKYKYIFFWWGLFKNIAFALVPVL